MTMKLTTKDLNSIKPAGKMKRIAITNSNLVVEVKEQGLTILFKYHSPLTSKTRLKKIGGYDHGSITKADIKLLKDIETKYQSMILIDKLDLMIKDKPVEIIPVNKLWQDLLNSSKMTN